MNPLPPVKGHPAQFSAEVLEVLLQVLPALPDEITYDPFAGAGQYLARLGMTGGELEPEWAAMSPLCEVADALDQSTYPEGIGRVVTSPVYGNRMADTYLGLKCKACHGTGNHDDATVAMHLSPPEACDECEGTGVDIDDQERRRTYATWLRRQASEGSACHLDFWDGPKGTSYRMFHGRWLATISRVLPPGGDRLVLNMKDHYRRVDGESVRQHTVGWWVTAARQHGFHLVHAEPCDTRGFKFGANLNAEPALPEYVLIFDLVTA